MPEPDAFEVRPLTTQQELAACVELQRLTWGEDFEEVVPRTVLKVSQRVGGVAAGAFAPDGVLLGFVFGMTGVERGRIVHWSDMLAVRSEARNLGIGQRLKEYQRAEARAVGAEVIYWTYDPLVARNAYLNLVKLGARVDEYVEDMYGDSGSVLHVGVGTDRFVVAWDVAPGDEHGGLPAPLARPGRERAPVLNGDPDGSDPTGSEHQMRAAAHTGLGRVAIPLDIAEVQARSLDRAAAWRRSTRAAFQWALARGAQVVDFYTDRAADAQVVDFYADRAAERAYYVLAFDATAAAPSDASA
jgi:predicted GNAT superfamily acetyltransferase